MDRKQNQIVIVAAALRACALVVCAISANAADPVIARGYSCGQWVSSRADRTNQVKPPGESWITGYLSGAARESGEDLLKGTDNESLFLWVDNYCRANPLHHLSEAAFRLSVELVKRKDK